MRKFKSEDTFHVTGRGQAYAMGADQLPPDLYDPCLMIGETVMIDGQEFVVKGVETFAIPRSPSSPYRHGFAVLV